MGPVFQMLTVHCSGQGQVVGNCKCSNEPLECHKVWGMSLAEKQLFKKDSPAWSR